MYDSYKYGFSGSTIAEIGDPPVFQVVTDEVPYSGSPAYAMGGGHDHDTGEPVEWLEWHPWRERSLWNNPHLRHKRALKQLLFSFEIPADPFEAEDGVPELTGYTAESKWSPNKIRSRSLHGPMEEFSDTYLRGRYHADRECWPAGDGDAYLRRAHLRRAHAHRSARIKGKFGYDEPEESGSVALIDRCNSYYIHRTLLEREISRVYFGVRQHLGLLLDVLKVICTETYIRSDYVGGKAIAGLGEAARIELRQHGEMKGGVLRCYATARRPIYSHNENQNVKNSVRRTLA